ncbi:UDP-3-O-acylglucosamine N-acyltransferase [Thalassocella blandensis]|nr:UDP-3-O-acylglucosamine N-acyltransferase [Thalassocella blandensis]
MRKEATLQELADYLGAELVAENGSALVSGLADLQQANSAQVSFLSSKSYLKYLSSSKAAAVIIKPEHAADFAGNKLLLADPYLGYAKLSQFFDPRPSRQPGVHPSAVVAPTAKIGINTSIGAHCVIEDGVVIGDNCEIYPGTVIAENSSLGDNCLIYQNVSIYSNVRIGHQVIIHSGTVIGSDGFGFAPTKEGWVKIHQIGGVVIGNKVEIGANTAIDRGALGDTVIHDGVIIDNLVHIAHNVEIGDGSAIAGCVGMAGSTKVGKRCIFGGGVLVNGHIELADDTHCHGGTIVTKSTTEASALASATPQMDVRKWRKAMVRFSQIDEMATRIKQLEKALESQLLSQQEEK